MKDKRRLLFVTGTRADFGKLKPLIQAVKSSDDFDYTVFVTGMHTLKKYGLTQREVDKAGFHNRFIFMNQTHDEAMEQILATTIQGLSRYVHEERPDLIVIHGDRVEALASAIVGALQNVLVAHIEGGELSGTIDDLIRHAVSKMSHIHFAANKEAATRLRQLGEQKKSIHIIGSPDIDVMLSEDLPSVDEVKNHYDIPYEGYAILAFHPVTTETDNLSGHINNVVSAAIESEDNFIVIYPNNDEGSSIILNEYRRLEENKRFSIFPSIRFESFLTLLKHSKYVLGNSSMGIREAPVYSVNTINVGSRQNRRYNHGSIINTQPIKKDILSAIIKAGRMTEVASCSYFGSGNSDALFLEAIRNKAFWGTSLQKEFQDLKKV